MKENKDVWGHYYHGENKKNKDIIDFTSINGFLPFSREDIKVTTKWINTSDKKILEDGCGSGRACIELGKKFPDSEVIGVDLSETMLAVCRDGAQTRGLKNVSFEKADIFKLPYPDNVFDVVFNKGTIEHFDNYTDAVKEMVRVTKKGGKVIIAVPNKQNLIHRFWYWSTHDVIKTYAYGMEILFTSKRLEKAMVENGLVDLEQDGFSVFYRLAKFFSPKNFLLKSIQWFMRLLAIILHYIVQKPFDFISNRKFSKTFGWEIVVMGIKS